MKNKMLIVVFFSIVSFLSILYESPNKVYAMTNSSEYIRYRFAYETASQSNVRLRAQNNNQSITGYDVSGYWDEETGVFKQN